MFSFYNIEEDVFLWQKYDIVYIFLEYYMKLWYYVAEKKNRN